MNTENLTIQVVIFDLIVFVPCSCLAEVLNLWCVVSRSYKNQNV